jgi:hypothetical protein
LIRPHGGQSKRATIESKTREGEKEPNIIRAKGPEARRRTKPEKAKKVPGLQSRMKNTLAKAKSQWSNN